MKSLQELVQDFADGVMEQKTKIQSGTVHAGNRAARKYGRAWEELRSRGDEGREALAALFKDERPDVRSMAAAHLLKYRTRDAKRVLKQVAKGEGLAAFGASEALLRWKEGDWHLEETIMGTRTEERAPEVRVEQNDRKKQPILPPIDFNEAFFDGKRIGNTDELIRCERAGDLVVVSGYVVACDPLTCPETPAFSTRIVPGQYPVDLSVLHFGNRDQRVACARVRLTDELAVNWQLAVQQGQDIDALEDSEHVGYGVDSGTGCFMDSIVAKRLMKELEQDDDCWEALNKQLDSTYVNTWSWANTVVDNQTGANLVAFSTGSGDGFYTSYFGLNRWEELVCLVTDFAELSPPPDGI